MGFIFLGYYTNPNGEGSFTHTTYLAVAPKLHELL